MTEGRIDKALSGFYYVATAAGETLTCRARGKFRKEGLSPLVGDRVAVRELGSGEGYVEEILPRRNALIFRINGEFGSDGDTFHHRDFRLRRLQVGIYGRQV